MAGPRTLAAIVPGVASKVFGKKGLAFGSLLAEWQSVVGPRLGERSLPLRIAFPPGKREGATLHLRVAPSLALDLQHLEPQMLERINGFFGYRAVARLKLTQGPVGAAAPRRKERQLSPADRQALEAAVSTVDDQALGAALARFGAALLTRGA